MTTSSNNTGRSWTTAAIGGGIVGIVILLAGAGLAIALVVGLVIFGIGLVLLPRGKASKNEVTREVNRPAAPVQPQTQTPQAPAEPVATETHPAVPKPTAGTAEQPSLTASTLVKASKALPGQTELAARKGAWRFENKPASA